MSLGGTKTVFLNTTSIREKLPAYHSISVLWWVTLRPELTMEVYLMCQMHHHWAITILNNHQLRQYGAVLLVVMGLATLPVLLGHQA